MGDSVKCGTFGCNPAVAGQIAQQLNGIKSSLEAFGQDKRPFEGVTGSQRVEKALNDFFSDSSDSRDKMRGLLDRAAGLLGGLAEGTTGVDQGLAGSLEVKSQPDGADGHVRAGAAR